MHQGPVPALLPAGYSTSRNRTQAVPAAAPAGTYTYRACIGDYPFVIYAQDFFPFDKTADDGSGNWLTGWGNSGESFDILAGVAEAKPTPTEYALYPAYPNPFNPTVTITYDQPQSGYVRLDICDLQGRKVADLAQGMRETGRHQVSWDAAGQPSGIYFCRIKMGDFSAVRKLMLLK